MGAEPRPRRRLASAVLLGAAGLALAAMPVRSTWWGGWVLAIAEAGIVGGLADWFAVTALFRKPLGLPIPHTALIPANWELLATRVGTMVGNRVLTREFLREELDRLDLGEVLARLLEKVRRADVEAVTLTVARRLLQGARGPGSGELFTRLRNVLAVEPLGPLLAGALDLVRRHGWDRRAVGVAAEALGRALDRPEVRHSVDALVEDVLARYRARVGLYPRLVMEVADLFGLIDRERIVAALRGGLTAVGHDAEHPLRLRLSEAVETLARRLREDAGLAARVESLKVAALESPLLVRLVEEGAAALRQAIAADLRRGRPEMVEWVVERLERTRHALVEDAGLRQDIDRWIKTRATELVERQHGAIAAFIEKGVRALGPAGAVRLVEEHAGDDLQYIRVNGTVVGGLAGGALYALHLLLHLL